MYNVFQEKLAEERYYNLKINLDLVIQKKVQNVYFYFNQIRKYLYDINL
jgi:hypothetical protein